MELHTWVFDRGQDLRYTRMTRVFEQTCKEQDLPLTVHKMDTPPRQSRLAWMDDNHYKLEQWKDLIQSQPPGKLLLISDSDMMCLKKPPLELFDRVQSLAFTRRDMRQTKIPCNAGMVVVRTGDLASRFMDLWWERDTVLYTNPSKHRIYKAKYAGLNQASLGWLLEDDDLVQEFDIQWYDCRKMNSVRDWPDWQQAYFIHVKSGLRRMIFGGNRTTNVPEDLVRLWHEYEAKLPPLTRTVEKTEEVREQGQLRTRTVETDEIIDLPPFQGLSTRYHNRKLYSYRRRSPSVVVNKARTQEPKKYPEKDPGRYRRRSKSRKQDLYRVGKEPSQIFIDLGANRGKIVDQWLEANPKTRVWAWEPNPSLAQALRDRYKDDDRVQVIEACAGTEDGQTSFYLGARSDQSSTMVQNKQGPWTVDYDHPVQVQVLDLVKWLGTVKGRWTMKMDVEGMEYEILPRLLESGLLKECDSLWVEWHWKKFDLDRDLHNDLVLRLERAVEVRPWK